MATVPDLIRIPETASNVSGISRFYRVVFIPGNPGLVAFYSSFLLSVHLLLQNSSIYSANSIAVEIIGRSLGGFEAGTLRSEVSWIKRAICFVCAPLGLVDQINFVQNFIRSLDNTHEMEPTPIILIGHSVGAYILLELMRLFAPVRPESKPRVRIAGGICLFPTVVDIANSPNGRKFGWLLKIPGFSLLIAFFAKILDLLLPDKIFRGCVNCATKFPQDAISTIIAFLRSPRGVRQALYMAGDEMHEIGADNWDETIWSSSSVRPPKLFFYFGRDDHWVADRSRDKLMETRAYKDGDGHDWKPQMTIDEFSIPHSFCIRDSFPIARVCSEYIERIILADS